MSNRTLVELNHDYCPPEGDLIRWAQAMAAYMRSGDPACLPQGVTFKHMRHHSNPCPIDDSPILTGEDARRFLAAMDSPIPAGREQYLKNAAEASKQAENRNNKGSQ